MGCITCSNEFGGNMITCPHDGTRLTPLSHDDLVGTVLDGRYEITELLGGGGMGLVYKAKHRLINRTVAIKVLHKHMVSSGDALKRFRLEAEAASSLNVPNILTIHDFGISELGQPYMVMDYLAGISLQDVLEAEGRLEVLRALGIFSQVCTALKHAHDKQILHRDLKPSNIMLIEFEGQPDFVKIVDFGIAKLLGRTDGELGQLTRTGEIFGSPLFMSPEQCRGFPLDRRTDIYSLGSVMYLALAGKPLFEGDNVLDIFFKQATIQPTPFKEICPELAIPIQVEEIVLKALEKEPSDRVSSMAELKASLDQAKENLLKGGTESGATTLAINTSVQDTTPVKETHSIQATPLVQDTSTAQQTSSSSLSRRQVLLVLSGAVVLVALLGLVFLIGQRQGIQQEEKAIGAIHQQQQENKVPVIIQQSLKPSEPVVAAPKNVDGGENPTLLHKVTEPPKPAPEINSTNANEVSENPSTKPAEPVHRKRIVRQTPHHRTLLKKAFQILEKAF
jgi:serine/threonine protein kinase